MAERVTAKGSSTSLADRKRRAGQRLVLGFEGHAVSDDLRRLVAEIQPAGFILFRRNVAEPAQVAELNRELHSLLPASAPALLCVDQEGGRVQRIKEPATEWPSARTIGNADADTEAVATALGSELRAMGFNWNLAPVADVDSNPDNPVIGDRSFGRKAADVARHVVSWIRGQQAAGVIATAKHFPGHGDTDTDSHLELPKVEREVRDLEHIELVPFRAAIAAGVGTVMTAHVMYPAWDEELPATLSSRILRGVLRQQLGFDGVIVSDDLEMKAIVGRWSIAHQVRRATEATVDLMLCCRTSSLQFEVFQEIVRAQQDSTEQDRLNKDAAKRVHGLRERFLLDPSPPPPLAVVGQERYKDLALELRARGMA